jgi:hypothetical protein
MELNGSAVIFWQSALIRFKTRSFEPFFDSAVLDFEAEGHVHSDLTRPNRSEFGIFSRVDNIVAVVFLAELTINPRTWGMKLGMLGIGVRISVCAGSLLRVSKQAGHSARGSPNCGEKRLIKKTLN